MPEPLWRRMGGILLDATVVAVMVGWFLFLRPGSLGGPVTYIVIHGSSMAPTYHDGDVVLTRQQGSYHAGEVVVYRVPQGQVGAGHMVIHRLVGGSPQTGFTTRGDNNSFIDPWKPTAADVMGSSWVHLPRLGRLLVFIHQPLVPATVAALITVFTIMRSDQRRVRPPATVPGSR
ncbi:MAG TPA: signal peptidase I [Candidatus Dormibacteraeota bacterium]